MSDVLICGSITIDTIMECPDEFHSQLQSADGDLSNATFYAQSIRREFGGCAANICYNLAQLGIRSAPVATVGKDFEDYRNWLTKWDIPVDGIQVIEGDFTAQAFITSDSEGRQVSTVYSGAMNYSANNPISESRDIKLGVISPDVPDAMLSHARQFNEMDVPFIFDPGREIARLPLEWASEIANLSRLIVVNQHEWGLLEANPSFCLSGLLRNRKTVIVTQGSAGSVIYDAGQVWQIPAVMPKLVLDATGCGDAYRAGLIFGHLNGWSWQTAGRFGAVLGAMAVEVLGAQNHTISSKDVSKRFMTTFGTKVSVEP